MSGGLNVIRQELQDISGYARDLRVGVNHQALDQERQRQEGILTRLRQIQSQLSMSRYSDSQLEASAEELTDILNLNADVLRYLDSISNLEKPISGLTNTLCKSAAAISHSDAAPVSVFANKDLGDSISNCWDYIIQLTSLAQFHLKAAASYQKFHHGKNELKAQLQKNVNLAEEKMRLFNPRGTVDEAPRLSTELQDQFNQFNRIWEDARQLSITSRNLLPLNLRMAEVRDGKVMNSQTSQVVTVRALVNIRDASFQVHRDDELLLLDNSDPIYWTVQTSQGPRQLPSVALSVIGPYSDGVFDINKLQTDCALGWTRSLERTRGRLLQYYTELFDTFCQSDSVYFRNQKAMDAFLDDLETVLILPNYDGGRLAKAYESFMRTIVLQRNSNKLPRDAPILRDIDITHMHAPLRKIKEQEKYVKQVQSQLSMNAEEVNRYLHDVEQERLRISTELADMERMQKNQEMQLRGLSQHMQQWKSTKHLRDRTVNEYLSAPMQDSVGSESQSSGVTCDLVQGFPTMPMPRLHELEGVGAVRTGENDPLPPQPPPPLRRPKLAEMDAQPYLHKSRSESQFGFSSDVRDGTSRSLAVIRCQTQGSRSFVFQQSVVPRQGMVTVSAKDTRDINTFVGVVNQPVKVQVDLDDLSQYEVVSCTARTANSMLKRSVSTSDLQTQILFVQNSSSTQYEPMQEIEGEFGTDRKHVKEHISQRPRTSDVQAQICKNVRDRGSQVGVIVIPTEINISRVELDNLGLEVTSSREAAALGLRVGSVLCPVTIGQTMELHEGSGIEVLGFNDVNSMRVRHKHMLATAVSQPNRDVETQIMPVHKSSRSQCDQLEDITTDNERPSDTGKVQTQIQVIKHTASVQAVAAMQVVEVPSYTTKKNKVTTGSVEATTKLTILPDSITMTTEEQTKRSTEPEEWDYMEETNDVMTQIGCILHSRGIHTDLRKYLSEYATHKAPQVDFITQVGNVKQEQYQTDSSQQANRSAETADLQTQILPVVAEEGVQAANTGAFAVASVSHGKASAKITGSTSASNRNGCEEPVGQYVSECGTQVSVKLIPTEISLSKIGLSSMDVSIKNNQQIENLTLPVDSIICPGRIKYDTQLAEEGTSIEVTDINEVSRFLVTNDHQAVLANLKSASRSTVTGDVQTQIFTLDRERGIQGAMILNSSNSDGFGLKLTTDSNSQANGPPIFDLQTQIGKFVERKDSKEQTFPSYAALLCTRCQRTLQDLQTQVSAVDAPGGLNSAIYDEEVAPRHNASGTVNVEPIREIESWRTKPESKSTVDNINQIYRINKNAGVQVGVELMPTQITMARYDTQAMQLLATGGDAVEGEQAEGVANLDAILCPARMRVKTKLVDGATGFQLMPVSQTKLVTLSVDNAGQGPQMTSSEVATPSSARMSTDDESIGLDANLNDDLDAYLVLNSKSNKKTLSRLLTTTVNSSNLRLAPIIGNCVSESRPRSSGSATDAMCQICKLVADSEVQVGARLVPQELSLSKVRMENLELSLKKIQSSASVQMLIDSLLYPLDVKMSTELCEETGITIARLDEVDQVVINTSSVSEATESDKLATGESEVFRTNIVQQPHMKDLETQIQHADVHPTMDSVMVLEPGNVRSASGESSVKSVAEVSCLLTDRKSEKRLCIVSTSAQHPAESPRSSPDCIGRVLTKEFVSPPKELYNTAETINQKGLRRDQGCQVGVRMTPTSVNLSQLDVENLSVELNSPENKNRLNLVVGSFLCPANIQMRSELYDGSGVCIQALKDTTEIALTTTTAGRVESVHQAAHEQEHSRAVSTKKVGRLAGFWQNISHSKHERAESSQSRTVTSTISATAVSPKPQSEEFNQWIPSTSNDIVLRAAAVVQPTGEKEEGDELNAMRETMQSGTGQTEFKIGALKAEKEAFPVSGQFDGTKQLGVLRTIRSPPHELREHGMQVGVLMVPEEIMISSMNVQNVDLEVKSLEQSQILRLRAGSLLYPAELKLRTELSEETSGIKLIRMNEIGNIQMSDEEKLLNGTINKQADGKQIDTISVCRYGNPLYDLQTQVGPITVDAQLPAALVAESTVVTPMPGLPLFGSTQTVARMLRTTKAQDLRTTLTVNTYAPRNQLEPVQASLAQAGPSFQHQTIESKSAEGQNTNEIMPSANNLKRAEEQTESMSGVQVEGSEGMIQIQRHYEEKVGHTNAGGGLVTTTIRGPRSSPPPKPRISLQSEGPELLVSSQVAQPRVATRDASYQVGAVLVPTKINLEQMRLDASQLEAQTRRAISTVDLPQDTVFCATDMHLTTVLTENAGISLVNMKVVSDIGVQWSKGMCVGELVHSNSEPIQTCLRLRSGSAPTSAGVYQSAEQIKTEGFSEAQRRTVTQGATQAKKEPVGEPTTSVFNRNQRRTVEAEIQVGLILVPTKVQMEHIGVDNLELSVPCRPIQEGDTANASKEISVSAVLCCSGVEMTPVLTTSPGIQIANLREMEQVDIQVKDDICTAHITNIGLQNHLCMGKYTGVTPHRIIGRTVGSEENSTANRENITLGQVTVPEEKIIKTNLFESAYVETIYQETETVRQIYEAIKDGQEGVKLTTTHETRENACIKTTNASPSYSPVKITKKYPQLNYGNQQDKIPIADFTAQAGSMLIPAVVDMKRIDLQGAELTLKNETTVASHEVNIPVASLLCANSSQLQSLLTTDGGLQMMNPEEAQAYGIQTDTKATVITEIGHRTPTDRDNTMATSRRIAQMNIQAPRSLKENMVITMPATAVLNGQNAINTGMGAAMSLASVRTSSGTDAISTERLVALLRSSTSSKRLRIATGNISHSDKLGGGQLISQRSVKDLAEEINRGTQLAVDSFVSPSGTHGATGNQHSLRSIQAVEQFPGTSIALRSTVTCPGASTNLRTFIGRSGTLMCEESMQVGTVLLPTKIHINPADSQILECSPSNAQKTDTEVANLPSGSLLVPSTIEMSSALAEVSGIHLVGVNDVSHMTVQMEDDMLFGEAEKNPSKELDGGQFQTTIRMLQGVHTTGGGVGTMQPMTFQVTVDDNRTCNTMQVSESTKGTGVSYSSQPHLATYTCACGRTYATSDFVPQPLQTSTKDRQSSASRLTIASAQSAAPALTGSDILQASQFNVSSLASSMSQTFNKGTHIKPERDAVDRISQTYGTGPSEYSTVQPATVDMSYAPVPSTAEVSREYASTVNFSTQAGSMLIPAVVDMKRIDLQGAELTLKNETTVASHEVNIPVASLLCANSSQLQSLLTTDGGLQMMNPEEAQAYGIQTDTKATVITEIGHRTPTDRDNTMATSRRIAQMNIQAPRSLKENMVITMPATAVLNGQNAINTGMGAAMSLASVRTSSGTDAISTERLVALLRSSTSSKRLRIATGNISHSDKLGGGQLISQRSVKDLAEEINRGTQLAVDSFVSPSGTHGATGNQHSLRSIQAVEQFPGTSIALRSTVTCPGASTNLRTFIGRSGTLMCEESMQVGTVLLPTKIHINPADSQILECSPSNAQKTDTEVANLPSGSLLVPSTIEMSSALAEVSGIHLVGVNDVSHMTVQMEDDMLFGEAEKNPSKELDGGQFQTTIRMLQGVHTTGGGVGTMQPMTFQVTVDDNRTCNTMQVSESTKGTGVSYSSQPHLATYTCACGRTYATSDFVPQLLQTSTKDRQSSASRLTTASAQSAAPALTGSDILQASKVNVDSDLSMTQSAMLGKVPGERVATVVDNFVQCCSIDSSQLEETVILMACGMEGDSLPFSSYSSKAVIGHPIHSTLSKNIAGQTDATVQCAVVSRQELMNLRLHPSAAVNELPACSQGLVAGESAPIRPTYQTSQNTAPDGKFEVAVYNKDAAADTQFVPICTVCRQRYVSDCAQPATSGRETKAIPNQFTRQNASTEGKQMDLLSKRATLIDPQDATADFEHLTSLKAQAAYVHAGQVESYINELTSTEAQQLSTVVVAAREMMHQTFSTTGRLTGVSTYDRLKEHNMVQLLVTEYDAARRSNMNWAQTQTEQMLSSINITGGGTHGEGTSRGGLSPPITIVRPKSTNQREEYSSSISDNEDESQTTVRPRPILPRSQYYCDVACTAQITPEFLEKRVQVTEQAIQDASQT